MKSTNIAKVFYTEYDAYFTVVYKSRHVHQYPEFKKPEFKSIAQKLSAFRFDIACINRVIEVQEALKLA